MTQSAPQVDARLSALETRVEGIAGSLNSVVSGVTALGDKLDKRSQPQWQLLIGALTLVVGLTGYIGTAWKAPIDATLVRQEADLRMLQSNLVTRAEHEVHWRMQERLYDFQRDRIGRVEGRMERRLERLEAERFRPGT